MSIYWERQRRKHTCGIHTLNSLLQGPYFNKKRFRSYAEELNKKCLSLTSENIEVIII